MELFFAPFACSLASHIVCREADLPVTLRQVNLRTKEMVGGGNFLDVNPKGQVPTLRLDDGTVLTEGPAVLLYLAERQPKAGLAPAPGSPAYYRHLEWLSFISSELHKRTYWMIFWPDHGSDVATKAREAAVEKLARIEDILQSSEYLLGETFTAADAYLLWWLMLARHAEIDLDPFDALKDYLKRSAARPGASRAIKIEEALQGT